jgi:HD-like signal output (HDOD) protein
MDKIKMNRDKLIQKIEQIPALPIIFRKIMEIAGDENASFKDLVEIIEKDQALALRILKNKALNPAGSILDILEGWDP